MGKDILNRCKELLAYSAETGQFIWLVTQGPVKAGWVAGSPNKDGYIQIQIDGTKYRAQRLAWLMIYNHWPKGVIDHIDGNVANNRIKNLRDVNRLTNQQNQRRAQKNNKTQALGVSARHGRFEARIRVNGVQVRLGSFKTIEQASEAYLAAKKLNHKGAV